MPADTSVNPERVAPPIEAQRPTHRAEGRMWLEGWPATRLALQANRRKRRAYWIAFAVAAGIQATILIFARFPYVTMVVPLYIVSWIVPAVAAIGAAHEITLGRWAQIRISCARTADLWVARVI